MPNFNIVNGAIFRVVDAQGVDINPGIPLSQGFVSCGAKFPNLYSCRDLGKKPITPPGETLRELLEEQNKTVSELACLLDITEEEMKSIISGKTKITEKTASGLEHMFNLSKDFWLQRQNDYYAWKQSYEKGEATLDPRMSLSLKLPENHFLLTLDKLKELDPCTATEGNLTRMDGNYVKILATRSIKKRR